MDGKKQHDIVNEKRKLKNTFSVPVKKSNDTHEAKNESKTQHKSTCPGNRLHISAQKVLNEEQALEPVQMASTASTDKQKLTGKKKKRKNDNTKTNKERITQTEKKTQKQAMRKNKFCRDKLHSIQQHDESDDISSELDSISSALDGFSSEPDSISSELDSISSELDSISRTIAEVVGRKQRKNKNAGDDSEYFNENDVDNWDLKKTGICDKSSRDKHSGNRQPGHVKSKKNKTHKKLDGGKPELITGSKDSANINDDQEEETGTWVQCSNKVCNKWRYLANVEDPVLIPENWDCTMNSDKDHNCCDIPEVDYQDTDHIYTKYTIGSAVWAKVDGYPWWPAMVECDPDTDTYFEVTPQSHMVPLQYHVSFFDEHVTRSWVRSQCLLPYIRDKKPKAGASDGSLALKRDIKAAMKNADRALTMSLKDRIEIFGFQKRFSCCELPRKKNVTRKNKSIKAQTEKSKVYASRGIQLNAETSSSDTHGLTIPDKLSEADSLVGNSNISVNGNDGDCGEKENSIHHSMESVEKKTPNKKRKHQKHKLPCSDDGHKHNKKFMLKESGTKNIPSGKENNTNNNISAGDFSDAVEKLHSPDQLHIIGKQKVIKKSKLKDKKGRQMHENQTLMQGCLKNDLLVQETKTEDIRCRKVQNDNIEELSVTMKTPPYSRKLEKARKIKQKTVAHELDSCKEETEMNDSTDKTTVNIQNESSDIKMSENNSDDDKEIACDSNMKSTEQASPQCIKSDKENIDSHKEYTNLESEIIVGITDGDDLCPVDSLHRGDSKPAVTDHQVVPDMGTELLTDCKSCPDMAFSSMIHKSMKREITDDIVVKALPDNLCEDDKYLGLFSLKLESNFPQKVVSDEDSLDENSDEMMLDLDESTGVALGETNKGSSSCDNSRGGGDPFYEFECAAEVDLIEE
ncbi:hypothetical protein BsWGS_26703 [Bradybaena similaris]